MKIAIILSHPLDCISGEIREAQLVHELNHFDYIDARLLRIGLDDLQDQEVLEGEDGLLLFKPNSTQLLTKEFTSTALNNYLEKFKPDFCIFKGLGYKVVSDLLAPLSKWGVKLGFIIGGDVDYEILNKVESIIFEEYLGQVEQHRVHANSIVRLLDKFIINEIHYSEPEKKFYDLVNVGNFDDARKNQEFLFPFFDDYKVAFIGGGIRLDKFRSLCSEYNNVSFLGYLEHKEVMKILPTCKVMLHSSRFEGFPRCIAEALSFGLPVVWYRKQSGFIKSQYPNLFIYDNLIDVANCVSNLFKENNFIFTPKPFYKLDYLLDQVLFYSKNLQSDEFNHEVQP